MKLVPTFLSLGLLALLLVLAACVSEVEREETPTPGPSPETPAPPSVLTPVPSATVAPTATATPTPPLTLAPKPTTIPLPSPMLAAPEEPVPQLVLDLRAPQDGGTVSADAVVVHGTTTRGAMVHIGGIRADVGSDGKFQAEVKLAPGINRIQVVATDSMGNRESRDLKVTSLALPPQPFLLLVTEPEDQSIVSEGLIRLSGRTGAEAIASVNGVSVPVDELGFFSTTVTLEPGPNIIDVVATDADGQVLSTVIAVIYRP